MTPGKLDEFSGLDGEGFTKSGLAVRGHLFSHFQEELWLHKTSATKVLPYFEGESSSDELVGAIFTDHCLSGSEEDDEVLHEGPIFYVIKVQSNTVIPREVRPSTYLPESCDTRLYL